MRRDLLLEALEQRLILARDHRHIHFLAQPIIVIVLSDHLHPARAGASDLWLGPSVHRLRKQRDLVARLGPELRKIQRVRDAMTASIWRIKQHRL